MVSFVTRQTFQTHILRVLLAIVEVESFRGRKYCTTAERRAIVGQCFFQCLELGVGGHGGYVVASCLLPWMYERMCCGTPSRMPRVYIGRFRVTHSWVPPFEMLQTRKSPRWAGVRHTPSPKCLCVMTRVRFLPDSRSIA